MNSRQSANARQTSSALKLSQCYECNDRFLAQKLLDLCYSVRCVASVARPSHLLFYAVLSSPFFCVNLRVKLSQLNMELKFESDL